MISDLDGSLGYRYFLNFKSKERRICLISFLTLTWQQVLTSNVWPLPNLQLVGARKTTREKRF